MKLHARVVPFSSVVGSSIALHEDAAGPCVAILMITGVLQNYRGADAQAYYAERSIALAEAVAAKINGVPSPADPGRPVPHHGSGPPKLPAKTVLHR